MYIENMTLSEVTNEALSALSELFISACGHDDILQELDSLYVVKQVHNDEFDCAIVATGTVNLSLGEECEAIQLAISLGLKCYDDRLVVVDNDNNRLEICILSDLENEPYEFANLSMIEEIIAVLANFDPELDTFNDLLTSFNLLEDGTATTVVDNGRDLMHMQAISDTRQ